MNLLVKLLAFLVLLIIVTWLIGPYITKSLSYNMSDPELNVLVEQCNELKGQAWVYVNERYVICNISTKLEVNKNE